MGSLRAWSCATQRTAAPQARSAGAAHAEVLTVENRRQALVRSVVDGDVEGDNKGTEAVETALATVAALDGIRKG